MKQVKSKIQPNVMSFIFDQNSTYIQIDVNTIEKHAIIETFKKNCPNVYAAKELLQALLYIKPHVKTIGIKSAPERTTKINEYMKKYNIKEFRDIRAHQQQNLNKYYTKLGFKEDDDGPNSFNAELNKVISTIQNLLN